ncbi:uncharacterized protein LTR77_010239 [Saxophila tyrrhenica]|uniref:Metallo-beta-lactamase domain-containing protein n=1 Tax=Saxophila tyrrhenica TaxID=1690608 RepID=A0AAV9P045_9PEZI|nr:hypothetical protein LTR77_010239 [Saxophila tyrrhenica]
MLSKRDSTSTAFHSILTKVIVNGEVQPKDTIQREYIITKMTNLEVPKHTLNLDPRQQKSPLRSGATPSPNLPEAKHTHIHPRGSDGNENAHLRFIGTATTVLEWQGIRILTDPNFLHAGDHVHLGPGVQGTRQTNPAIDLEDLPNVDVVLLSHYHADHFDQKVEAELRRDLPIVTTPHAKECLQDKKSDDEKFTAVHDLDFWESATMNISSSGASASVPAVKVTGMPGKHVPPGPLSVANDLLSAVPPTNGWMLELGYSTDSAFNCGYRIYISGDTLLVDDLKQIPEKYTNADKPIDLMLVHLGGTTIPSPKVPLLMVTMDAQQGVKLMQLVKPDVTVPIHYDDYDVFLSPLEDFKKAVQEAGLESGVVYLDRGEGYRFGVKGE